MKKTLKELGPAMMRVLERRYGKEGAAERRLQVERQYAHWLREEGDLGGKTNIMASNMTLCYAVCAFYEALDCKFTKEEFDAFLRDAMGKAFVMLNHLDMNRLEKKRWLMGLVYRYIEHYKKRANQKRGKAWGNTWKIRVNPDGRQRGIAYVLDTCPLYEFAQKHGYMDILPYMCAADQLVARQFHAHLIRHRILSDGDGCCEYWFVGDQFPEAMPDQTVSTLQKILDAGMEEFQEKGFRDASLWQIVKNAGVTTGAFYGYFSSKEALFASIVEPHAAAVMGKFMTAQTDFAGLPQEEQPAHLGVESGDCVEWMIDYMYDHYEPVKLLICRSDGTPYENFIHNMVEVEVDYTFRYYRGAEEPGT